MFTYGATAALGIGVSYMAYHRIRKYISISSALQDTRDFEDEGEFLEVKLATDNWSWKNLLGMSDGKGLILQQTQTAGMLYEEKILPLRKDVTVVKSSKDLPSKDQLVAYLSFEKKVLLGGGLVFGAIAIGIFAYSHLRQLRKWAQQLEKLNRIQEQENLATLNWIQEQQKVHREYAFLKWRKWREQHQNLDDEVVDEVVDDDLACVVCKTRFREYAFIPCGDLAFCRHCAFSIQREESPKCPQCKVAVSSSMRVLG